jgi:hypothetical protein
MVRSADACISGADDKNVAFGGEVFRCTMGVKMVKLGPPEWQDWILSGKHLVWIGQKTEGLKS